MKLFFLQKAGIERINWKTETQQKFQSNTSPLCTRVNAAVAASIDYLIGFI